MYDCDNDVCDSQMVNIQFEGGAIANLTMTAFTRDICARYTRITGSKGEIQWRGGDDGPILVENFLTGLLPGEQRTASPGPWPDR